MLGPSASILPEIPTTSRFYITLQFTGATQFDGYFMECSSIQRDTDVIEVVEVFKSPPAGVRAGSGPYVMRTKIPGNVKFTDITLKRGLISKSIAMWTWLQLVQQDWATNRLTTPGMLNICTQDGQVGASFTFLNAWPSRYNISPVDVKSNQLAIEELTLVVEDLQRTM